LLPLIYGATFRRIIKKAGRKAYSFVVGKINVPKLANFSEVDVFVLVACPENSLLDSRYSTFLHSLYPYKLAFVFSKGILQACGHSLRT
jgi:diphthamide biosynthesis protein 2